MEKSRGLFLTVMLLIIIGVVGAVFYFVVDFIAKDDSPVSLKQDIIQTNKIEINAPVTRKPADKPVEEFSTITVYQIRDRRLEAETVSVKQTFDFMALTQEAVKSFLSPEDGKHIPKNTTLNGLYYGVDNILYVDLSKELARNFQGDSVAEFLIIKGLFKTIQANANVSDVKLLVGGLEVDTFGGHFMINYPIKNLASQEVKVGRFR